mgnify:CR=1 FL=1
MDDEHVLNTNPNYGHRARAAAYFDAQDRSKLAEEQHTAFFESAEHNDAVDYVIDLLNAIFERNCPDYQNSRGLGRQGNKPFTALKWQDVGSKMSNWSRAWKEENIYTPLRMLGITNAKCNLRGEFVVRVYNGPAKK